MVTFQSMLFKYTGAKIASNWNQKKTYTIAEFLIVLLVEPEILKVSLFKDTLELYPYVKSNFQQYLTKNSDIIQKFTESLLLLEMLFEEHTKEATDLHKGLCNVFRSICDEVVIFAEMPDHSEHNRERKKREQVYVNFDNKKYQENTKLYCKEYDKKIGKVFHVIGMKIQRVCLAAQGLVIEYMVPEVDSKLILGLEKDFKAYKKNFHTILVKLQKEVELNKKLKEKSLNV